MTNKTMYEKEKKITDKIDVKEAIKMFQNLIFVENHKIAENHCRKLAIEALEKQTPQKPITETVNRGISASGEYDIDFNYLCPNCKTVVGDYETNDFFYKFCPECGQFLALDWNEYNERFN